MELSSLKGINVYESNTNFYIMFGRFIDKNFPNKEDINY